MATYYVRTDGSDANTGLGPGTGQAWASVQKAINSGGVTSGDTVYIAPGTYRETAWSGQTFTSTTTFIGDALATQFTGVTPAPVIISTRPSDGAASTVQYLGYVRSFTTIQNVYFDSSQGVLRPYGENIVISDCVFQAQASSAISAQLLEMQLTGTGNITIRRCIGVGVSEINCGGVAGNTGTGQFRIESCSFYSSRFFASGSACTFVIVNSNFTNSLSFLAQNASGNYVVFNCILGQLSFANPNGTRTENYNYYTGAFATSRQNVTNGANSIVNYGRVTNWGYFAQNGLILTGEQAPIQNGPLKGAGTSSLSGYSAPTTDLYNKSLSSPPDIGAVTSAAFTGASYYIPTERNASTITIAPGSTSQSIELYLGATGLTASTSGLSAHYNRTRTASVSIPLVARTIAQAWTSGGFAEVDATNMPGVYRLDVPDAALAAGADDVTVVVRGASGTNGAVMTVKLSSGGLTSAQTASAVWGADVAGYVAETNFGGVVNATRNVSGSTEIIAQDIPSNVWEELTTNHTTHNTFGWNILRADAQSKQGLVTLASSGGTNRVDADIHAIVNDTAAAVELKGALLHTGGDYITADLQTPITSTVSPAVGPFTVLPSGAGADNIVDLNVGSALPLVLNLQDGVSAPFNASGATITATVYTAGGSTVTTYTGSIIAGYIGAISVPLSTAVTATSATYTMLVSVVIGTTTTVFGPLKLVVRAI